MGGALSQKTREFYIREILKVLKKYKRISTAGIVTELKKLGYKKYTMETQRIVHFLKYLRAKGLVRYIPSKSKRLPSKWEIV